MDLPTLRVSARALLLLLLLQAPGVLAQRREATDTELFPVIFNLATRARISVNATCGEQGPEVFCKLVEHVRLFPAENRHCDVCDARSPNEAQRHPITNAIDGSNRWWQSPTITNGNQFHFVTIELDLGQVFQVAYVIVKAANSPRPGNWILERSVEGREWRPWQYFAMTDKECRTVFGVEPTVGVPLVLGDDEVICTSRYSELNPLENGEIFVSLVNGRPGVYVPSKTLIEFTSARYMRLRLLKIRTLNADLMTFRFRDPTEVDPTVTRRYYYSIKDISIGGQCICYGHADYCRRHPSLPDRLQCQCQDNTCGDNCEECCPLFNQQRWSLGTRNSTGCEECNCHGKASACVYNETVARLGLSLNKAGVYSGGGVCVNCKENTEGVNCERCQAGFYRPRGVQPSDSYPCRQCRCQDSLTATAQCVPDDSRVHEGLNPGDCICKPGYSGPSCNQCALGFYGYPNCRPCFCNAAGIVDPRDCVGPCRCKRNVEGMRCEVCRAGHFNLDVDNPEGCSPCFCFGVSTVCNSMDGGLTQIAMLEGWILSTREPDSLTLLPRLFNGWLEAKPYILSVNRPDRRLVFSTADIHYWVAPMMFIGNRLSSYGGMLHYTIKYILDDDVMDVRPQHISELNVIIEGAGMSLGTGREFLRENQPNTLSVLMHESAWKRINGRYDTPVSKQDFMAVLADIRRLLIRATYHTRQDTVYLKDVTLDMVTPLSLSNKSLPSVEQCMCPQGYSGMSCESCAPGFRRLNQTLYQGVCLPCNCYNHADRCDPFTGRCLDCKHNTKGDNCEKCEDGYFGDPRRGSEFDCLVCACPSPQPGNHFAERCVYSPTRDNPRDYQCVNCREGYFGKHCEMCAPGYYGNPREPGGSCRRCDCSNNIDVRVPGSCHNVTGECLVCSPLTEGARCERCRLGYFGTAINGDCQACNCYSNGSYSDECDRRSGQCPCRPRYGGRRCDQCQAGYGNVQQGCVQCNCDRVGSTGLTCDVRTGQCPCRPGVAGMQCDRCQTGYFGFSPRGCESCNCDQLGTNLAAGCSDFSGQCVCLPHVVGRQCDRCEPGYWGLRLGGGCRECGCDRVGSESPQCQEDTGQCRCRPGVGGRSCDECLPGFFGFSVAGCRECEPCNKEGHICDPQTGRCLCPPNTRGPRCEDCRNDTWGYDPKTGCKKNVRGPKCDECKRNTFSLDIDNPYGCTECYCFRRSYQCQQAPYMWTTINDPTRRVVLTTDMTVAVEERHGQLVIPLSATGMEQVGVPPRLAPRPLYWSLPPKLMGDKTLAYGGRVTFIHYFESPVAPDFSSGRPPFAMLLGNGFLLHYRSNFSLEPMNPQELTIRLHENFWHLPGEPVPVDRSLLMVVLQRVEDFFIQATPDGFSNYAELGPTSMQIAVPADASGTSGTALGIEQCVCPPRYSGLSCQDPADGYYRFRPNTTNDYSTPERTIGDVYECNCYGHSDFCDKETGVCQNCRHNTTGDNCEQCLPGFYGIATRGTSQDCMPCSCPLPIPSNNFSPTCEERRRNIVCLNCSIGYIGPRCERCDVGYYGNPMQPGDKCRPCVCNPEGSIRQSCDQQGRCDCRPGIKGDKCDQCQEEGFAVQNGTCMSCYEGCTGILLTDLREIGAALATVNVSVPLPWDALYHISNQTDLLRVRVDTLRSASAASLGSLRNDTDFLDRVASRLSRRLSYTQNSAENLAKETPVTKKTAMELEMNITELFREIRGNISQLEELTAKLFDMKTGLNFTAAFLEAQRILAEIEARDFSAADKRAYVENLLSEKLSESINMTYLGQPNASRVREMVEDSRRRLEDLYRQAGHALNVSRLVRTEELILVADKLARLEDKMNDINDLKMDTTDLLKDGRFYVDEARKLLDRLRENFRVVEREFSTLEAAIEELMRNFNNLNLSLPMAQDIVNDAFRHARRLQQQARELDELFSKTRGLAADPLKAASVYKEIVDAVLTAETAARNALNAARNSTQIANVDRVKSDVQRLLNRSRELMKQANKILNEDVDVLTDKLALLQDNTDRVMDMQDQLRALLDMLNSGLGNLPQDLTQRARDVADDAERVSRRADAVLDRAKKIADDVEKNLKPKAENIDRVKFEALMLELQNRTEQARRNANALTNITATVDQQLRAVESLEADVSGKLRLLRERISQARQQANNMRLSLGANGQCVRSYHSVSLPATTNSIVFSFRVDDTADALFLLLQESPQEFIAVELRDRRVRFSWNLGGGGGSITHPLLIEKNTIDAPEQMWFKVRAQRIGRLGLLKVVPLFGKEKGQGEELSGTSDFGNSLLQLNKNSDFFLGGANANYPVPAGVTRANITGCVGDVVIDDKPVGTFHFKNTSASCGGCIEPPREVTGTSVYSFDGSGYVEMRPLERRYNSRRFAITISFKTFWQDALLIFAGNTDLGDFLSLELREGRVVLQYYMGGVSLGKNQTKWTYNTNQWVNVRVDRSSLDAIMDVDNERITVSAPPGNMGLDLKGYPMHFGGLPDSLDLTVFKKVPNHPLNGDQESASIETAKFLGCMKDVRVGDFSLTNLNLFEGNYIGMAEGCRNTTHKKIGFRGSGFAEYSGQGLGRGKADISLSFVTKQSDALLLLARDPSGDSYYSISLRDGKVEAWFASNSPTLKLVTGDRFDDGVVHNVAVQKDGQQLTLMIDDTTQAVGQLPPGVQQIALGPYGRLYLGGVPQGYVVDPMTASARLLDGCLSFVIINGMLMNLNLPLEFRQADIGRCAAEVDATGLPIIAPTDDQPATTLRPLPPLTRPTTTAATTTPTTTTRATTTRPTPPPTTAAPVLPTTQPAVPRVACAGIPVYPIEGEETKNFVDAGSYAQISVDRREMAVNFDVTLTFRTFYEDGLIFLLTSKDRTTFLYARLTRGEIYVTYDVEGTPITLIAGSGLADGQWHKMSVVKSNRRLRLSVDSEPDQEDSIARRFNIDEDMFLGALPSMEPPPTGLGLESFRGCFGNISLNSVPIDLTTEVRGGSSMGQTKVISGINNCYKRVEPGAYFDGSSWGVYSRSFEVGDRMTVTLEFRTHKQEGILLTISERNEDVGMTLELFRGQAGFRIRNSDGQFQALTGFPDRFQLCDGQWHRIKAEVIRNVVTLEIDDGRTYVGSSVGPTRSIATQTPLFIGGFSSQFKQSAATTTEGFVGCLRNVEINNNLVRWYDLEDNMNIERSACPLE